MIMKQQVERSGPWQVVRHQFAPTLDANSAQSSEAEHVTFKV